MNKTELARKIQSLEGLDNEEKSALLELLRHNKKYGLVWEDKSEEVEERLRNEMPVLVEDTTKALTDGSDDSPNHILIEGDNLEALTTLAYTHAGKIDVIYIDPPYNTGHEDFIYNDDYISYEDAFKHSTWISFMKKRLVIAKKLLSERGVIFISIDDNEQANLKLLCDEVFLERNFLGGFIHQRAKGGGQAKYIVKGHDYIFCYAKTADLALISRPKVVQQRTFIINGVECMRNDDVLRKTFGKYDKSLGDRRCFYEEIVKYKGEAKKAEIDRLLGSGQYVLEPNEYGMHTIVAYVPVASARSKHYSIIKVLSEEGKKELEEIGITNFDYPKPTELIRLLAGSIYDSHAYILDFFAGSGTTLHAVMQLNAEDGGKRQCILCTNNENGICENVTYERNKRVIKGYTKPNGEFVEGLKNNNLRYYRTELLPRERTVKNMRELMRAATGLLCIKNDNYTEASFGDQKLNSRYARFFDNGKGKMLIIYEEQAIPFIVDIIKTMPKETKIKVYVFSHGSYAYNDEFAEVEDRVELCALPQAIYDAYQKVLPKAKPTILPEAIVDEIEESETEEGGEA